MIFIDSNIPMYLVGTSHPHKLDCQRLLERAVAEGSRLVTDAEVLQEILHRYSVVRRMDAVQPAFEALLGIVDEVFALELQDAQRAKELLLGVKGLSARDAVHLATMERYGVRHILSFDKGVDVYRLVTRIS